MTDELTKNILELIRFVAWYASQRGEKLTTLRIVKFLYLIDYFYAQETEGQTFTNWPWAFVYFGPYCKEVMQALDEASSLGLVEKTTHVSQYEEKDYNLYFTTDDGEPRISRQLPIYVVSEVKAAIRKWGNDTNGLLDFVYFDTEPMQKAQRGQKLDFSDIRRPEIPKPLEMRKLPKEKLKLAKEAVERLKQKHKHSAKKSRVRLRSEIKDDMYRGFVAAIEDEDLAEGLTGEANLGNLESE